MKVAVVGGRSRADYLIGALKRGRNEVVAINADRAYCEMLSSRHDIQVTCGNGTKYQTLDDADIGGFDVIVALTSCDADNLVICQLARHFFDVKTQLCVVANPENVEIFRRLGVTAAISGTLAMARAIQESMDETALGLHPAAKTLGLFEEQVKSDAKSKSTTSSWHRLARS